jgi:hypothetical protein
VEDPFRIDEVSKKSSLAANALSPLDETAAHEEEVEQQPVRAQRSLQRDLDTLQDAARGAADDNSSLRSRFSVQGRNNRGKTRTSTGPETAVKNGESARDVSTNEWIPDETEVSNINTSDLGASLSTPENLLTPSLMHGTGDASSSGDGQISSAARRHPSVLIQANPDESESDEEEEKPNHTEDMAPPEPRKKTSPPSPQPSSTSDVGSRLAGKPWVWLAAGLTVLVITALALIWLWPSSEVRDDSPEVVAPNDVGEPSPSENAGKPNGTP